MGRPRRGVQHGFGLHFRHVDERKARVRVQYGHDELLSHALRTHDVLPLQGDGEPLRRGILRPHDDALSSF